MNLYLCYQLPSCIICSGVLLQAEHYVVSNITPTKGNFSTLFCACLAEVLAPEYMLWGFIVLKAVGSFTCHNHGFLQHHQKTYIL